MAAIRAYDGVLAITSGSSVAVASIRKPGVFVTFDLPTLPGNAAENKDDDESSQKTGPQDGSGSSSTNRTLASGFSGGGRGRYFALCDDRKMLHVYLASRDAPWTLVSSRLLARRATSVTFTLDESTVVVADKSGDVYSFPTATEVKEDEEGSEGKTQGQLLLGHLSMVLDVCLAQGDRYVVTCDRDEKIRMSHFPNSYNVHAYCLGHTQFVTCLTHVEEFSVLISGSGDCSLRVWNMEGKQLCQAQCPVDRSEDAGANPLHPCQGQGDGQGEDKKNSANDKEEERMATEEELTTEEKKEGRQGGEEDEEEDGEKEGEKAGKTRAQQEREDAERVAVRGVVYCKRCRLLVVSFHSLPALQVYKLGVEGGAPASLDLLQTVSLPAVPWDVTFDDSNTLLWVLSPVQGATLSAFRIMGLKEGEDVTENLKLVQVLDDGSEASELLKTVNSKWDFFAGALAVPSAIPSLWKAFTPDQVSQYQQRKAHRLQGQAVKDKKGHDAKDKKGHDAKDKEGHQSKDKQGHNKDAKDLPEKKARIS